MSTLAYFTPPLEVDAHDVAVLETWAQAAAANSRKVALARRARIVLLSRDGVGPSVIADRMGCSRQTVVSWRERYRKDGLSGLLDRPRAGRPTTVDANSVIGRTLASPPSGALRWSTRLLAAELGISNAAVAQVWRTWGLRPGADGMLRLATQPQLGAAVSEVVGLYADAGLRLLVVRSGPTSRADTDLFARSEALGSRLTRLEQFPEGDPDPGALAAFLRRMTDQPGRCRGLVGGSPPASVTTWVRTSEAVLHTAPATGWWARMARLVCVLAAATPAGASGVKAMHHHLTWVPPGSPVSWVAADPPPPRT